MVKKPPSRAPSTVIARGDRQDVLALASRIKRFLPGGDKYTDTEALALAQLGLALDLNAFLGDIFYLKKGTRAIGLMVGIKGDRKIARRNGARYQLNQRQMTMQEREEHCLAEGDTGRVTELRRYDMGIPPAHVEPFIGIGIVQPEERPPATKSRQWLADKRSEADALRKAYGLTPALEKTKLEPISAQALATELVKQLDYTTAREFVDLAQGDDPAVARHLAIKAREEALPAPRGESASAYIARLKAEAKGLRPERPHTAKEAADLLYGDWDGEPTATPAVTWGKPAAQVKTDRWEKAIGWLLERTDFYLDPNDDAATEAAILETALGLGFPLITDDNLKACLGALLEYAKEELAQEGAE